ncbi:hypothetical protein ACHAPJ_010773 [Fusarium lateritium]
MHVQFFVFSLFGVAQAASSSAAQKSASQCTQYMVQEGDTCLKVAKKNKATYAQIVSWNSDIQSLCSKIGTLKGTRICVSNTLGDYSIPTNTQGDISVATTAVPVPSKVPDDTTTNCGGYSQVKEGQHCSNLLTESGITMKDFIVLNPQVWENCTNLWLDYYYCVKPVGSISTYWGHGDTATTTVIDDLFKQLKSSTSHNVANPLDRYHSSQPVIPLANGTRKDCDAYYWVENITDNGSADCWALTNIYSIEPEDFVLWNPALVKVADTTYDTPSKDTTNVSPSGMNTYSNEYAYPCTVSESQSYCVRLSSATDAPDDEDVIEAPTPRAAGEIANCTSWFLMKADRKCDNLMLTYSIEFAEFYKMNPSVGKECTGLVVGTNYCKSTKPGGKSNGIPGWSSTADDESPPTSTISSSNTGTAKSTTVGTSTTVTKGATSSPVQSGISKSCTKFHKVIKDDTCYDIAQTAKVKVGTFYSWNPAVKTDCSALQLGDYVCISVS